MLQNAFNNDKIRWKLQNSKIPQITQLLFEILVILCHDFRKDFQDVLTFKAPVRTAADDSLKYFFRRK